MTLPSWLGRAARNPHRHAIEQASRRWRGGRRGDPARTRRKILISTQAQKIKWNAWNNDKTWWETLVRIGYDPEVSEPAAKKPRV